MPDNNTIGQAYLQIKPSMKGITGEIEQAMGDAGHKGSGAFGKSFASGVAKVGQVSLAAVGAAATGVAALTKSAVSGFADYEQLVGGVETLFGDSASIVQKNAEQAFSSAGLSANEYMETVTSFSASLLQSLEGDTAEAASVADMAIRDMADNANKMGTSMESIQNAYQGFAKQNYTMLDNLKLGYGGTKSEMERLLADAQAISGVEYNLDSLSDVYAAINVIQTELGITGTTAAEAEGTISGSLASLGSSWENLVNGLANPDADLSALIDNLATTAGTAVQNLIPAIEQALPAIGAAITELAPIITEQLPGLLESTLPVLLDSVGALIDALVVALPDLISIIIEQLPTILDMVIATVLELLPMIIDLGLDLILALAEGIIDALPELIPAIVDVVLTIVDKLTQPDMIVQLIDAALQLIIALAEGLITALPRLLEKLPEIISNIVEGLIMAAPALLAASAELIMTLLQGVIDLFPKLLTLGSDVVSAIGDGLKGAIDSAKTWGKDLIDGFLDGIMEKWNALKQTVSNVAQTVKDFLGFSVPDKGPLADADKYGPDFMELFASGVTSNVGIVKNAMLRVGEAISGDMASSTSLMSTPSRSLATSAQAQQTALAGAGVENITIPVYLGDDVLDTVIVNANQRINLRSGGTA